VSPNEGMLGMYISCKKLDEHGLALVGYFNKLFQDDKKRALISFPLIMMVDPTLSENKLSIKILNLVSGFLKTIPILCELTYNFAMSQQQRTGLDVLFYGQEHFDTLAILSQQKDGGISESRVADLMKNQKLFTNKELMLRNMTQLCLNMRECEEYIEGVVAGRRPADPHVAHALNQCIS
jgi:hypothetical protein